MTIKLLIGGSPCTHWSVAQKKNRETKAEGLGWELFENYLIAKEKFQPDLFLYENNKSAAPSIKEQVSQELGVGLDPNVRFTYINSSLVSAQNRERFYITNFEDIEQPKDRGILLRDVLEDDLWGNDGICVAQRGRYHGSEIIQHYEPRLDGKTNVLTTVQKDNMIAQKLRSSKVGCFPSPDGTLKNSQGMRLYDINAKSVNLTANGGGLGAKTGLYTIPICSDGEMPTHIISSVDGKQYRVYKVKDGRIGIRGASYPIKLEDGYYIIRKLTVKECCRLQTLPDDYCRAVAATRGYQGLGNGWTAEVIIHLLTHALGGVPRDERIIVLSMYDGIGTGRYCLDKMGFENVEYYAYEIDKYAVEISKSNYPDIIQLGDAFQVRDENWSLFI
ncbi:site-specific DNA-cytosine methylase [Clostridiales Family XIII bacterium PM5-7]